MPPNCLYMWESDSLCVCMPGFSFSTRSRVGKIRWILRTRCQKTTACSDEAGCDTSHLIPSIPPHLIGLEIGPLRHYRLSVMHLITREADDKIYNVITLSRCLSYDCVAVSTGFSCPTRPPGEFFSMIRLVSQLVTRCCHRVEQMWPSACRDTAM